MYSCIQVQKSGSDVLPAGSKLLVTAPRVGTWVEKSFWIVEDHHVCVSLGCCCQSVKDEKKNPAIFISLGLGFYLMNWLFFSQAEPTRTQQFMLQQKSFPKQSQMATVEWCVAYGLDLTSEINFAPNCRM